MFTCHGATNQAYVSVVSLVTGLMEKRRNSGQHWAKAFKIIYDYEVLWQWNKYEDDANNPNMWIFSVQQNAKNEEQRIFVESDPGAGDTAKKSHQKPFLISSIEHEEQVGKNEVRSGWAPPPLNQALCSHHLNPQARKQKVRQSKAEVAVVTVHQNMDTPIKSASGFQYLKILKEICCLQSTNITCITVLLNTSLTRKSKCMTS